MRKVCGWAIWAILVLGLGWCLGINQPAIAAPSVPERVPLTPELLQQRLKAPIKRDGMLTVDLRRLMIDLRPENAGFRDQFYREVQAQLQSSGIAIALDLSYSEIQGDFLGNQLGLRTPLYGESLSPNFTAAEQTQLNRDRRRLFQLSRLSRSLLSSDTVTRDLQLEVFRGPVTLLQTRFKGRVDFSNTFFLGGLEAQGSEFLQAADWSQSRFSQPASFANSSFNQVAEFRNSIFFNKANFNQARFLQTANFQSSEFQGTANFSRVRFAQLANFNRVQWQSNADFAQSRWQNQAMFSRNQFNQALFLTETIFEKPVTFRESQFNRPVNLRGASILDQADFSDTRFSAGAKVNIPELQFDPKTARILGDPGLVSRVLSVPTLRGNEILLRNLVRNFRQLEQIGDANQIEYLTQKLRLQELRQEFTSININRAAPIRLQQVGFTAEQTAAIAKIRQDQPFRSLTDLMSRNVVDLSTYIKVRNRVTAGELLTPWVYLLRVLQWLGLSILLVFTCYGRSFWLIFGIGLIAIAYFGLLFWFVDCWRKRLPSPILPELDQALWMGGTFIGLSLAGVAMVFRSADYPWLTLIFLGALLVPVPGILMGLLYQRGRFHDLMEVSYFVEDGSMRQVRLMIGRLPNVPRFPFFRERYEPILWHRRWSWLNYYDLSLINFLKFGFNDIRLRDQHVPGLVCAVVWYQWGLGLLYIGLLLWTLSRTIPGLNLFIYF